MIINLPAAIRTLGNATGNFGHAAQSGNLWVMSGINTLNQATPTNVLSLTATVNTQVGAITSFLTINPTYNVNANTTSASELRGVYYNPTITSIGAARHIAWENTTGNVLFGTTSGSVGIGNTAPGYLLQVGNASVSGIVARFQNSTGTCDINPTTSSLTCSSDRTLKKNITPLDTTLS